MAFAGALLENYPDEALAILTALRTALNNTGCRECLENFAGFVWNAAEGPNGEKVKQLASGLHGPLTRVTAAAEAVWKAFTSGEWRQLAPYVGPMTRVHVQNYLTDPDFGGDGDWTKHLSRRALRSFSEERHGYDPTRGDNWFCDARCCEYWTANQGPGRPRGSADPGVLRDDRRPPDTDTPRLGGRLSGRWGRRGRYGWFAGL